MKQDGIRNEVTREYVPVHNACTGGCCQVQRTVQLVIKVGRFDGLVSH
jgi:hypothetical protein